LTFFAGDTLIARRGLRRRKSAAGVSAAADTSEADAKAESGQAIVLGATLDGIPESIVIGASLLGGGGVSVAMLAAVFVSNVPESIAATDDLVRGGTPPPRIIRM